MTASADLALKLIFWANCGLIAYTYLLYPCLMWALAKIWGRRGGGQTATLPPKISLIFAAYNEAAVIEEKIRNCLGLRYPAEKIEILIGSDGSSDRTVELARSFGDARVKTFPFPRRGKIWVINDLAAAASGDILIFSDANTLFALDAIGQLVAAFNEPSIGCASGLLHLRKKGDHVGASGEGFYWKYETFKKRQENAFHAVAGANGAIYAIRKELFTPLSPRAINDDFTISMKVFLQGKRLALVEGAEAFEWTAPDFKGEFRRHVRDSAGHFQAIMDLKGMLNPFLGMPAFCYVSHRLIRWLVPFFMIGALASAWALRALPLFRLLLIIQVVAYGTTLLLTPIVLSGRKIGPLFVPYYFITVNLAILVGFWRFCDRSQTSLWEPTARTGSAS